jgi:hypothetical protein
VVGVQGFEPWTPCSQSRCATRLRYTPTESIFYTDRALSGKSCKIPGMVAYFSSKYLKRFQAAFSIALLLFCLLGTHWIGFSHSISHAGLHSQSIEKCSADDSAAGITHSSDACHLFDALTLAGFVPVGSTEVVSHSDLLSSMIASVDLILAESSATAYQSRAPPTFIL